LDRIKHITKISTEALVVVSKEISLETNAEKTKYMIMSQDQDARQSHNIKIANASFEREKHFKHLGTTLTNQNSIHEKVKSRLKSGNACYHSVQNVLSSNLLSKKIQVKIYRIVIFCVVLYRCDTWSLTLREERRLRVFENRVLKRIFRPKKKVRGKWRRLHITEFYDLYSSPNAIQVIKSRMTWGEHGTYGRQREVHTGFLWGDLRNKDTWKT
jgi:hypothetical protein